MRDGARLHTLIFAPKDTAQPLPMMTTSAVSVIVVATKLNL